MTRRGGIVLVDKPPDWTSHDVVAWLRARLGVRRVGHAGTLDPLATGLLPCLVGPATRLTRWLHLWPKTYVGEIVLGLETPTGDAEGVDPGTLPAVPLPPAPVLERARRALEGEIEQVPPAFSAKKLRGTRAHRLARRGRELPLAPVRVTVHRLRLCRAGDGRLAFAARVSSGTYLRSLARDLGRLLGTGAFLARLRRTAVGPLRVRGAVRPLSRHERQAASGEPAPAVLPPEAIPLPLPDVGLAEEEVALFRHGRPVTCPGLSAVEGAVRVLGPGGTLAGIGEAGADGRLQPRVVLDP
ncbi:MAG: tRNA pseudouridine(55) synthase TruB [Acidobacteriota bacterium]